MAKPDSAGGGLIRMPRFDQIASDWNRKDAASVAMIGGMRSSQISSQFAAPQASPTASAAARPASSIPAAPSISFSDSVPASVIVAGIDRSTLPGPRVMTSICPSPTSTEKDAKVSAAPNRSQLPPTPFDSIAVGRKVSAAAT